jgi:trk system potassium uptake protein TrkH
VHVVGWLLVGEAAVMTIPAVADAQVGSPDWSAFILSAFITAGVGGALVLASGGGMPASLTVRQTFLLTTLAWTVLSAFAAIPFVLSSTDLGLVDALYEATSGLTTAGGTVIVGLDALPPGPLLWRILLNWFGGIGLVAMTLLVFPFLRVGGMQLFRTESSDRSDKLFGRAKDLAATIATVYAAITTLSAVGFHLAGLSWFDAIAHGMSAVSTGGFSTQDASLAAFPGVAHYWVATASMIAGALPMTFYVRFGLHGRGAAHDAQVKAFLSFLAFSWAVMAAWALLETGMVREMPVHEVLAHVAVNVTSVVTTTGLASDDYGAWGGFATVAFFALFFVGGCTGSTSGSIKIFRWQVLVLSLAAQMRRMVTPHRVTLVSYGGKPIPDEVAQSVVNFVVVYVITFVVLSLVLAWIGLDFLSASSGVASALSGVGPGLGEVIGPAGNYAALPDSAKLLLCVAMLLGRLEILTVLVLLTPGFWK